MRLSASDQAAIRRIVGSKHISTSDQDITNLLVARLKAPTPPQVEAVVAYALKVHHQNQELVHFWRM